VARLKLIYLFGKGRRHYFMSEEKPEKLMVIVKVIHLLRGVNFMSN
jgi:hypothetical protein